MSEAFVYANYVEAALWLTLAAGTAAAVGLGRISSRRAPVAILAAATLAAFGVSDLVETPTGAWWRPWWLLGWKAACVATFGWCGVIWRRRGPARAD